MRCARIFAVFFLAALAAAGEEKEAVSPLLAITDMRTLGDEASIAEAQAFSEFIRSELAQTKLFRVLSRSSMMAILKTNSFPYPCHELQCFASMGRLLGADQVLAGHIQRKESGVEVTMRLIDVKSSRFLNMVYRSAAALSDRELMGEWGRDIIYETFKIDPEQIEIAKKSSASKPQKIDDFLPPAIKFKYPGMIYIPAGETVIGANDGDVCEQPVHKVYVEAFYIGEYETTNAEYMEFVKSTGHRPPLHWKNGAIPDGFENHPVTWVSYEDAEAYCKWINGRLPTETEWERAAHGSSASVYPWGRNFSPRCANTWEAGRGGMVVVGSFPLGDSPYQVKDMAGNAFEWVADFFLPYPGATEKLEEYDKHLRILRGGSWNFNAYYARTTHRFARAGGEQGRSYGFRLARSVEESST